MTRTEVIALLTTCGPLASRLTAFGIYIQLDKEDRFALENFYRVWEAGWVGDFRVQRLAGLNREDITVLTAKLKMELSSDI